MSTIAAEDGVEVVYEDWGPKRHSPSSFTTDVHCQQTKC